MKATRAKNTLRPKKKPWKNSLDQLRFCKLILWMTKKFIKVLAPFTLKESQRSMP